MFWIERKTWGSGGDDMVRQSGSRSFRACCTEAGELHILQFAKEITV